MTAASRRFPGSSGTNRDAFRGEIVVHPYTYSQEKYEPCMFADGSFQGPPEVAFEIGAVYLRTE